MYKIKLKENQAQSELFKLCASKDKAKAFEAREAIAAAIGPVVSEVLMHAGTVSKIFTTWEFNEDDGAPTLPLDLFYTEDAGYIVTFGNASMPGGIPTSHVEGISEMRLTTMRLDSAVSYNLSYARKGNLNVLAKIIQRFTNELLVKRERNGWAVLLKALGEATTNGTKHTIASNVADQLTVDDFSRLLTRHKRLNMSYADGTPSNTATSGVTDLFLSPELMQEVRGFAYQPVNTRSGALTTSGASSIALPDSVREDIFKKPGLAEIYNITLHELLELGLNQKYNVLFDEFDTTGIAHSGGNFSSSGEEIAVGFDLTTEAFIRPVAVDGEAKSSVVVTPDDQFLNRSGKAGYFTAINEGYNVIDSRAISGIVV